MKTTTLELIRSVLKSDETISADERGRIIRQLTAPGEAPKAEPISVIKPAEAARRLQVSKQTVYRYTKMGILKCAVLPGKTRSNGIVLESLEAAMRGKVA
ncbi:MAG: helix-turn-helix domain-containing protein [Candidatus Omnitrophota bacterium]|jgi:predicted transcriptional regulator YheO